MKSCSPCVYSILALLVTACAADRRDTRASQASLAKPGAPVVVAREPMNWPAFGKAVRINYETAIPITDTAALREEALLLWRTLQPEVEQAGYCTVELKASEPMHSFGLPGSDKALVARRNYSFVVRHTTPGAWDWLARLESPPRPCVE